MHGILLLLKYFLCTLVTGGVGVTPHRFSWSVGCVPCDPHRTGDVRSFNALMEQWERVFITNGTYLLMEKCLMLVYRNLVKKM